MTEALLEYGEVIRCKRCGRKGFKAVSDRAKWRGVCVSCDAKDGGPKISIMDDEDLCGAEQTERVSAVRVIHLTARMENWEYEEEIEAMEALC